MLVSTPTAMHFEHVSLALAAGKHVLVEKPMALDLAQGRQLVEEAATARAGAERLPQPPVGRGLSDRPPGGGVGALGKVINVESRLGQFSSCVGPAAREYRPNWRNEATLRRRRAVRLGQPLRRPALAADAPGPAAARLRPAPRQRLEQRLRRLRPRADRLRGAGGIACRRRAVGLVEINTTTNRPLPRWHLDGTLGSASSPASPQFDTRRLGGAQFTPAHGSPQAPPAWAPPEQHVLPKAAPGLSETGIWERFAAAVRGEGEPAVPVRSVLPTMALAGRGAGERADGEGGGGPGPGGVGVSVSFTPSGVGRRGGA